MKNISIQVPNMQSSHCQARVRNAISLIEGVTIENIQPGLAVVKFDDDVKQKLITDSIEKAGYTISGLSSNTGSTEFRFTTNINCGGCVSQVTPALNEAKGIAEWEVDTGSSEKVLRVKSDGITREEVIKRVNDAGFKIESINN